MKTIKGLKFLTPDLATYHESRTDYTAALSGWMTHPGRAKADGKDCGPGGYHIMLVCSSVYAPPNWWPWHAYGRDILGQSSEKCRIRSITLRPIPPTLWWRYLRRFGSHADLSSANLHSANLNYATYNEYTLWPTGFDPEKAGARKA